MNTREKFSAGLFCMGLILAILPISASRSFNISPARLMTHLEDKASYLSVDQVARLLVTEDSAVRIIDLRSPEEYNQVNIPGSINVPYKQLLDNDPGSFLGDPGIKKIFYSNGDFDSNFAFTIANGLNYKNIYVMKGGLNEWFNTVMNSSFEGERISPRENALFEIRYKARRFFSEINSLPDSLKTKYYESKHVAVKLDGGCE